MDPFSQTEAHEGKECEGEEEEGFAGSFHFRRPVGPCDRSVCSLWNLVDASVSPVFCSFTLLCLGAGLYSPVCWYSVSAFHVETQVFPSGRVLALFLWSVPPLSLFSLFSFPGTPFTWIFNLLDLSSNSLKYSLPHCLCFCLFVFVSTF